MNPRLWQALAKFIPFWLGVAATTIMIGASMAIIDSRSQFGRLCMLFCAVANAYGIHGVATWSPPREPWTPEQKQAESLRRISMGHPPLVGYEYLVTGRGGPGPGPDPTLPPPPMQPPPLPPPPGPNEPLPPPPKGGKP